MMHGKGCHAWMRRMFGEKGAGAVEYVLALAVVAAIAVGASSGLKESVEETCDHIGETFALLIGSPYEKAVATANRMIGALGDKDPEQADLEEIVRAMKDAGADDSMLQVDRDENNEITRIQIENPDGDNGFREIEIIYDGGFGDEGEELG